MKGHEKYMARCIELALLGAGEVAPNPMVGCVIVHHDKIIGEGYHHEFGGAHAEVNAVNAVKNSDLLPFSTMYVALEPCAHYGKTPPCSLLILEKKIPHIVIGTTDPFAEVAGKGIAMMQNAGVEVITGVLEDECRWLNRRFFTFHEQKRPYIILKWAQTADGFLDADRSGNELGQPLWITNIFAHRLVHKTRAQEAAILVGTNTVMKDNPELTVRHLAGQSPVRVVIDRTCRLPLSLKLFDNKQETLVFTAEARTDSENIHFMQINFSGNVCLQILQELYKRTIQSVIIEGGAFTLESFISQNLWDEAHVYVGDCFFHKGIKAPAFTGKIIASESLDSSLLAVFNNNNNNY